MNIENIDLKGTNLSKYPQIVEQCQEIINENLQSNGGTLKIPNIFDRDYAFTNLLISTSDGKINGFALIRLCDNMHNLRESSEYYYLSDVVVRRNCQKQGIGTALMEKAILCTEDMPLVASCLKENQGSIKLLSKNMTCYGMSESGLYLRFVDNNHYAKLYNGVTNDLSKPNAHKI